MYQHDHIGFYQTYQITSNNQARNTPEYIRFTILTIK